MAETALITIGSAVITVGTVATAANYAFMVYGLYRGVRERHKLKDAQASGLASRGYSVGSSDMPRSILYGEREIDGRVLYVVEPKDEPKPFDGGVQPAQQKFYVVKALEPAHEIDGITTLLFNGKDVGPFQSDPNDSVSGAYVAPGSEYYLSRTGTATAEGVVSGLGIIGVSGLVITRVVSLSIANSPSVTPQNPNLPSDLDVPDQYTAVTNPNALISLGEVILPLQYAGLAYKLVYEYQVNKPLVRAWFGRGTTTQTVNQAVKAASGGQWNDNCRVLGTPHVIVEITPDLDKFPNGPPYITAIARGKRGLLATGGSGYSRNPADHIYDYLKVESGVRDAEINLPMLVDTRSACAETVTMVGGSEPRYCCDALLSTENDLLDNFRYLLGAMAGTAAYSGGSFDIRAGVAEAAAGSLDESDLASGAMEVVPFPELMDSFNSVKGRHPAKHRNYEVTDYAPYSSAFYVAQDQGEVQWEEIDQPCVVSGFQVQRIARLLLNLNRNSQTFAVQWNAAAKRFSAGQVVNVSIGPLGFTAKPYRIMTRKSTPLGTVETLLKEEPAAVYSHDYREDRDPDPAPNTTLEPVNFVEKPVIESIITNASVAEYGPDGSVRPIARIKWFRPKNYGITLGGRVEVQYRFGNQSDWTQQALPGDTTKLDVTIQRSIVLAGRIRFMNAAQVYGDWTTFDKVASDAPTQPLLGNLIQNAAFELADPNNIVPEVGENPFPGWEGPFKWTVGDQGTPAPAALYPYLGLSNWAAEGFKTVGMVFWSQNPNNPDYISVAYPATFIRSKPIALTPKSRMLLSIRAWTQFCRVRADVFFYNRSGAAVGAGAGSVVTTPYIAESTFKYPNQLPRPEIFDRAHVFIDSVPDDAATARVHLNVHRTFNSDGSSLPESFAHYAILFQPYFSLASPGQVTHPVWSK